MTSPRNLLLVVFLLSLIFMAGRTGFDMASLADLMGTDSYLRFLTLDKLLQGGNWYDHVIHRTNWPYGLEHHWTRAVDLLLLPLASFLPLFTAALIYQFALLVLFGWGMVLAAGRLGATLRNLVIPALLLAIFSHPYLLAYFTPGRVDHHALLATLLVWLVHSLLAQRLMMAGLLAGLGVWVSVEFFLPLFFVSLWLGWCWLTQPETHHLCLRRFFLPMLAVISIAIPLERPLGQFSRILPDSLSWPHFVMIALSYGAGWMLSLPAAWRCSLPMRALKGGLYGAAIFILTFLAFPTLLQLDFVPLQDAQLAEYFRSQIGELASPLQSGYWPAPLIVPLLALLVGLPRLQQENWPLPPLLLFVLGLGMCALLMTAFRWIYYAVPIALLFFAYGLSAPQWESRRLLRMVVIFTLVLVPLSPLLDKFHPAEGGMEGSDCSSEMTQLIRENMLGDTPLTVALPPDYGYEMLYFTPHRILAANNHRNVQGLNDLLTLLQGSASQKRHEIAQRRQVDIIINCQYDAPPMPKWVQDHSLSQQLSQLSIWQVIKSPE